MRVFIVSGPSLFGQGIEGLLRRQSEMDVVGQEADASEAVKHIEQLQPDVVILDSSDPASDPTPALMRCLRDRLVKRIISLNLQDNSMCVYCGDQRAVAKIEDLLEAIKQNATTAGPVD